MLIGYNPKVYIKEFLDDLLSFYKEQGISVSVTTTDSANDIYSIYASTVKVFDITLYDITNFDNNMYQEMKIYNFDTHEYILNVLLNHNNIKIIQKTDDIITFIVLDDIIVSE